MPKTLKEVFPHKFSAGDSVKVVRRSQGEWCRVGSIHTVRVCKHDHEHGCVYVVDEDHENQYIRECNLELLELTPMTDDSVTFGEQWHQIDGPIKWRDTIIHCQAIIEDCEREIERNVQLLDAEGLMMQTDSKKAMQDYATDVDMSDWRNWKVGDIVSVINDCDINDGEYAILEVEEAGYDADMPIRISHGWPDMDCATIKFVRRP
jgi:hypothetical protein